MGLNQLSLSTRRRLGLLPSKRKSAKMKPKKEKTPEQTNRLF